MKTKDCRKWYRISMKSKLNTKKCSISSRLTTFKQQKIDLTNALLSQPSTKCRTAAKLKTLLRFSQKTRNPKEMAPKYAEDSKVVSPCILVKEN